MQGTVSSPHIGRFQYPGQMGETQLKYYLHDFTADVVVFDALGMGLSNQTVLVVTESKANVFLALLV